MVDGKSSDKWSQAPVDENALDFTPEFSSQSMESLAKKAENVIRITGDYQHSELTRNQRTEQAHNELVVARRLFSELEDDYGIPNAGFAPFIGESKNRPRAMVSSRYVDGKRIDDECEVPSENKEEAKKLLNKLTNYLTDKFEKHENILTDVFRISQYVLDNKTNTFTLVDMDTYSDDTDYAKQRASLDLRELAHRVLEEDELKGWYKRVEPIDSAEVDLNFDEDF